MMQALRGLNSVQSWAATTPSLTETVRGKLVDKDGSKYQSSGDIDGGLIGFTAS